MTDLGGFMGKVLKINLSTKEVLDYPFSDRDRRNYIGGKIMAIKIISDVVSEETKAYDEENVIVISTGPLTLSGAPSSSRYNISTISPLTNQITSSNCGGNFGLMLKRAGIDALVIVGKAEKPMWIKIEENKIGLLDVSNMWGMSTYDTEKQVAEIAGKLVIGPAGENKINYACLFSQNRSLGKDGIGAVFGSKNLKVITAIGNKMPRIIYKEQFNKLKIKWIKSLIKDRSKIFVRLDKRYQDKTFDTLPHYGCQTCPISCNRVLKYHHNAVKGKELEALSLLGNKINILELDELMKWKIKADEMGLDTITLAKTVTTFIDKNVLFFGLKDISKLIEDIAHKKDVYKGLLEAPFKNNRDKSLTIMEKVMNSVSAAGICLFTFYQLRHINKWIRKSHGSLLRIYLRIYMPHLKAIKFVTGLELKPKELMAIGEKGYHLESVYNKRRQ